ncbi:hypothetical protein QQ020_16740 [Fulvivirgaceae bacterium BMA12]|uniref:Uncharacterized protein n=1 Tax=Agaribacillus aureus TaxID=3051825 RepID=A0ABT8L9N0_9BACT|nr:hypothetical protein [Fulvivirgaceae bacterium BMA12]
MKKLSKILVMAMGVCMITVVGGSTDPQQLNEFMEAETAVTVSGTINVFVDGGLEETHSVSGTQGVNNTINRLDCGSNNAEGTYTYLTQSGATIISITDVSPHEVKFVYNPSSNGFLLEFDIETGP